MGCCTKVDEAQVGDRGARVSYAAAVENRGDSTYLATTRHGSFVMSTAGRAANPVDTLLASLCACVAHYAGDFLREERVAADGLHVSADATGTPDGRSLARIDVRVEVRGASLDGRQRAALLGVAERCKVHNTLRAGCELRLALAGA